jgi:dolichyl-phosphate-mannose-protein mannosyltransferase
MAAAYGAPDDRRIGFRAMVDRNRLQRVMVPAVLVGVAGVLLFVRLGHPATIVFDETYYVSDARQYLETAVEGGFAVHPPVGKWLIAAGIALFGDDAVGWRAVGALSGALTVLLTYLLGLRLFRRVGPAALAGLLLATDGLFLVQARTAMLDIFLAMFTVLGAWLLVRDRQQSGLADDPPSPNAVPGTQTETSAPARQLPRHGHPYRLLAGVAFGLAIATKWSGLFPLGAAGLLALVWELQLRRRWTRRWSTGFGRAVTSLAVGLVLVPAAVYALSYIPWLVNYPDTYEGAQECAEGEVVQDPCPVTPLGRVAGLARNHASVWRFHTTLEAEHHYRAPAYTWPVMSRPVVYYYESCDADRASGVPATAEDGTVTEPEPCVVERGDAAEIVALGNPALWWGFLAAAAVVAAGLVRRDPRAAIIAAFWGAQFLPWLIVSRPVFFFYMVPVVPFLALAAGYTVTVLDEDRPWMGMLAGGALGAAVGLGLGIAGESVFDATTTTARWLGLGAGWLAGAAVGTWTDRDREVDRRPRRWSLGTVTGAVIGMAAVGLFIYFLPVWTGIHLDADAVRQRWWFSGWV